MNHLVTYIVFTAVANEKGEMDIIQVGSHSDMGVMNGIEHDIDILFGYTLNEAQRVALYATMLFSKMEKRAQVLNLSDFGEAFPTKLVIHYVGRVLKEQGGL